MRYINLRSSGPNMSKQLLFSYDYKSQAAFEQYILRYKLSFDKEVDNVLFYKSSNTDSISIFIKENNFLFNVGLMEINNVRYSSWNSKEYPYNKKYSDLIDVLSIYHSNVYDKLINSVVAPYLSELYNTSTR